MPTLQEFDWLQSPEAQARLVDLMARADSAGKPSMQTVAQLRKDYPIEQTHLLLEQAELRVRARKKFSKADQMLLTSVGLEQATDEQTARYKASRLAKPAQLADLCCGIGGDLLALPAQTSVTAVDRDLFTLACAQHNAALYGLSSTQTIAGEVAPEHLDGCVAWHIDPDRRAAGRRTTQLDGCSPSLEMLTTLRQTCPHSAIKLAPATEVPPEWEAEMELEWISQRGECRQLVAWGGDLTTAAGQRKATLLTSSEESYSFIGEPDTYVDAAPEIGGYLFDPNPAVLAAQLVGALASHHTLQPLAPGAVYLTGSEPINDPLLRTYTVQETLPLDRKPLASYLSARSVGTLEIKTRGIELDIGKFRKSLRLKGDAQATLVATRLGKKKVAIIAQRCG